MYLLLSGEGVSDMGRCLVGDICEPPEFQVGVMAIIVDQLIDSHLHTQYGYELSLLDSERVTYVSESYLAQHKPATSDKKWLLGERNAHQRRCTIFKMPEPWRLSLQI